MKCLILGGAGFLGSHIADQLVAAGHDIRLFDRFEAVKTNIQHLLPRYELMQGDFGNHAIINDATRGIDVVYHLISTTLPKTSNDDMAFDLSTNVVSTISLLDACKQNGVKKVVFISSGGTVYGTPQQIPIPETHPTNPICSYGIHKLAVEKYLHLFHFLHGLDYAVMRVANPYGERQRPDGSQGAVAVFLGKMLRNEPIEIWGDGSVVRDYLYVQDVAVAAEKLASCALARRRPAAHFRYPAGAPEFIAAAGDRRPDQGARKEAAGEVCPCSKAGRALKRARHLRRARSLEVDAGCQLRRRPAAHRRAVPVKENRPRQMPQPVIRIVLE